MDKKKHGFSLAFRNLRYKLRIAFYLMSVLPLLVTAYLASSYILPKAGLRVDIVISLVISVIIAAAGFFVVKGVFDRIISVSSEARLIAAGDINRRVVTDTYDEVGDLGGALNQLTGRIRSNMDELKDYSEKTTEINIEIQKRVILLSSLMQISSLIAQGAKIDDILKVTTQKSRLLANSETAYLLCRNKGQKAFSVKVVDGMNASDILRADLEPESDALSKVISFRKQLIMDKGNTIPPELTSVFQGKFKLKNTLALPVHLKAEVIAVLGIGNNLDSFTYRKDDMELLDIFAKQIAISVENDTLIHRVEKLEVNDALTGLFNEAFIRNRLQEEIRRSIVYQRPCGFILLNIDDFRKFQDKFGSLQAESTIKRIAFLIRDSVREIDRVGRVGDDEFAVVLPEKNKRQSQEIAEDIRKKVVFSFNEEQDPDRKFTVSGGVSENPLDGITTEELISKAKASLNLAKMQGKNRIMG